MGRMLNIYFYSEFIVVELLRYLLFWLSIPGTYWSTTNVVKVGSALDIDGERVDASMILNLRTSSDTVALYLLTAYF